jgi:adenosylmethionine-8-amino-7-oxononanoate aminotransferase
MDDSEIARLAALDKRHLWHPFTPMAEWCADAHEPLIIRRASGCHLEDSRGNRYLDGNSSIWTCIHGHAHPRILAAIQEQAARLSHCSFLGLTNEPAIRLAAELVRINQPSSLSRVFFSDDGSTAVECAARMALQFWAQNGRPERRAMISFDQAYHGDTLGAVSLGGIPLFQGAAASLGYPVQHLASAAALSSQDSKTVAAVILEPLVQGAAGMRLWPPGMLRQVAAWCREHDVFLILDEVMTGFGRTGSMFAWQREAVAPDFLCLAKGLTGGAMPLAATLTTERVFEGFLDSPGTVPKRAFYHGHSYSGNPLGCAAALASLRVFEDENVLESLPEKIDCLAHELEQCLAIPGVIETRQCGLIAGIEVGATRNPRTPFPPERRMGAAVCLEARRHGLLTRPVLDTIVLMPPLAATLEEIRAMGAALRAALHIVLEGV